MINKGFLNIKDANTGSRASGKINVDVDGLAARMKRLKGNDDGVSDVSILRKAVRVVGDPNSGSEYANRAMNDPKSDLDHDGNMVDDGNDVGNSGVTNILQASRVNVTCLSGNSENVKTGLHSSFDEVLKSVGTSSSSMTHNYPSFESHVPTKESYPTFSFGESIPPLTMNPNSGKGNIGDVHTSSTSASVVDGNLPDGDGVHVSQRAEKMNLYPMNDTNTQVPSPNSQSQSRGTDVDVGGSFQEKPISPDTSASAPPSNGNPKSNQPLGSTGVKSVSYAGATSNEPKKHVSNFRRLECSNKRADVDLSVPMKVVEEVNTRFENTLYGYFIGQCLAFPVVDYYVRNAWAKFGIQKVMMNAKGFFFFKFNSSKGVDDVLENGPWLIRNVPIILKPWTLNTNLLKEDLTNIPVWVKFHDVHLAMFSDDGLSLFATLIGTPKRLDAFTNQMCKELWGRSSFARCMFEVKSDEVFRDCIIVEIPLLDGTGSTIEKIRVEYEWKPPRCDKCKVFGHTLIDCPKFVPPTTQPKPSVNDGLQTVNNKKKSNSGG